LIAINTNRRHHTPIIAQGGCEPLEIYPIDIITTIHPFCPVDDKYLTVLRHVFILKKDLDTDGSEMTDDLLYPLIMGHILVIVDLHRNVCEMTVTYLPTLGINSDQWSECFKIWGNVIFSPRMFEEFASFFTFPKYTYMYDTNLKTIESNAGHESFLVVQGCQLLIDHQIRVIPTIPPYSSVDDESSHISLYVW
jgi:hypothetical protein